MAFSTSAAGSELADGWFSSAAGLTPAAGFSLASIPGVPLVPACGGLERDEGIPQQPLACWSTELCLFKHSTGIYQT